VAPPSRQRHVTQQTWRDSLRRQRPPGRRPRRHGGGTARRAV